MKFYPIAYGRGLNYNDAFDFNDGADGIEDPVLTRKDTPPKPGVLGLGIQSDGLIIPVIVYRGDDFGGICLYFEMPYEEKWLTVNLKTLPRSLKELEERTADGADLEIELKEKE